MNRDQRLLALQTEYERLKTRLDAMERQISGDQDAWWQITTNLPETVAEVNVRPILAEARQHATALAGIAKVIEALSSEQPSGQKADPLDEIGKKREAKLLEAQA